MIILFLYILCAHRRPVLVPGALASGIRGCRRTNRNFSLDFLLFHRFSLLLLKLQLAKIHPRGRGSGYNGARLQCTCLLYVNECHARYKVRRSHAATEACGGLSELTFYICERKLQNAFV